MLKTLFASTLLLTVILPAKAQVGPGLSYGDHIGTNYGRGQYYAQICTRQRNGRLSLRTGPGQEYRKLKEIPNGHRVALMDSEYGNDGFRWWNVLHNGNRGWVRADYVCGDPDD
jgi:hypothetical protein